MNSKWLYSLSEQEKEELAKDFKACALTRERLVQVLENEIDKSLKDMREAARSKDLLNLPEYYADELSKQRTLDWVIRLIK